MPTVAHDDQEAYDMEVDRTAVVAAADVKLDEDHLDVDSGDDVGEDEEEEEEEEESPEMAEYDDEDWTILAPAEAARAVEELESIRQHFDDEVDMFDTTMVAEYADDIFAHMEAMEQSVMPNPKYMDFQTEIEW
jgi:G2/mitotic-specific cyclin 1/2